MAIAKKGKAKQEEEQKVAADPRAWTPAQRREMFLKHQQEHAKADSADWRILRSDLQEVTTPWGYITLDSALRLRQIPRRGRIIQIHGDEGAGKSTLTYGLVSNYIRQTGEPGVIHDFERTSDWSYLTRIGIPKDMCEVYMPLSIAESSKRVLAHMQAGVRLFVYDSIPRMKNRVDEKEIMSGDAFGNMQPGVHAKAMAEFWDTMAPYFAEYDCTVICVNQTRDRIESSQDAKMAQKYPTFTNLPYKLPGGRATRFIMSVMIELKRMKAFKSGELIQDDPFVLEPNPQGGKDKGDFVATQSRARVIKNKINDGGFREAQLFLRPGVGIDDSMALRFLARQYSLIANAGAKYYVGDKEDPIATYNNKEKAIQDLVIDPNQEVLAKLRPLVEKAVEEDQSSFMSTMDITEKAYLEGEIDMDEEDATVDPKRVAIKIEDE